MQDSSECEKSLRMRKIHPDMQDSPGREKFLRVRETRLNVWDFIRTRMFFRIRTILRGAEAYPSQMTLSLSSRSEWGAGTFSG